MSVVAATSGSVGGISLVSGKSLKICPQYERTILDGGEVLINVRGTLGGCAVVPRLLKGFNIARAVIPVHSAIDAMFLANPI